MCQCVQNQVQPEISTIQDGYEAVRLIEAALESAETGQWVLGEASAEGDTCEGESLLGWGQRFQWNRERQ